MKFLTPNPNFTVVLPGECNASCPFCFWKQTPKESLTKFMLSFERASLFLPIQFRQLSISGGEPTLSPIFGEFLEVLRGHKDRWQKVVLTTNGSNLLPFLEEASPFEGLINHVNLSRHDIEDVENYHIFNTDEVPSRVHLTQISDSLSFHGIDLTLNVVREDTKEKKYTLMDWVNFAKEVGASRLVFRLDIKQGMDRLHEYDLALAKSGHLLTETSECPVCKTNSYLVRGLPVSFKYAVMEPSKVQAYEVVLQPSGVLTLDWEGKKVFTQDFKTPLLTGASKEVVKEVVRYSCGTSSVASVYCGSRGC